MLVDPRPYTYEYRKPRYSNPTFQSRNLYGSLYHKNEQEANVYFTERTSGSLQPKDKVQRSSDFQMNRELSRNYSDLKGSNNMLDEAKSAITDRNPEKYDSGYKLPSIGRSGDRVRVSSNLGNNMESYMSNAELPTQKRQNFERFRIYERQQKPYNIINYSPKEQDNNRLRNFPKLTLENKLIERGSYHSFNE